MNKDNSLNDEERYSEQEDDFISKSQLKREAKLLQDFARELLQLPIKKREALSLLSTTIRALDDYVKQTGNIAKKRHIAYIAKCLRHDNVEQVKQELQQDDFEQFRAQAEKSKSQQSLVQLLLEKGDEKVEELIKDNPTLERQALRQMIRNIKTSKTAEKKDKANLKLVSFLKQHLTNNSFN